MQKCKVMNIFILLVSMFCLCIVFKTVLYPPVQFPKFEDFQRYDVEVHINSNRTNNYLLSKYYENICNSDKRKTEAIKEIDFQAHTADYLRQLFHEFVMNPHRGRCAEKQKFGGQYIPTCKYWDGTKYICISELLKDIQRD